MSVIPNDPLDNKNFILYDMNVIFNGPLEKKIVSYIIWITIIFNDPLDSRVPQSLGSTAWWANVQLVK